MNGKYYFSVLQGRLSDDDYMAVVLTVKDWKAIRDQLYSNANTEKPGPAESALYEDSSYDTRDPNTEAIKRARKHDARVTACHESAEGTERCADAIAQTLTNNGWTD